MGSACSNTLEKKSISITRLKLNKKTETEGGDFELEKKSISITRLKLIASSSAITRAAILEKKSISITRLKLERLVANRTPLGTDAWKEKHLDYEIETHL